MSETTTNHDEHCPYKVERDALRERLAAAEGERDLWHERAERVATTRNVVNNEANRLSSELSACEAKLVAAEALLSEARRVTDQRHQNMLAMRLALRGALSPTETPGE